MQFFTRRLAWPLNTSSRMHRGCSTTTIQPGPFYQSCFSCDCALRDHPNEPIMKRQTDRRGMRSGNATLRNVEQRAGKEFKCVYGRNRTADPRIFSSELVRGPCGNISHQLNESNRLLSLDFPLRTHCSQALGARLRVYRHGESQALTPCP